MSHQTTAAAALHQSNNATKSTKQQQQQQQQSFQTMQASAAAAAASSANTTNGLLPATSFVKKQSARDKEKERMEREKLVLWRHPFQTAKYCLLECMTLIQKYGKKLQNQKTLIAILIGLISVIIACCYIPGAHQNYLATLRTNIWFITYWIGLGVLSSVGLGTGLHTFLLYLGPHIASVTIAAYECNSLDFPTPPYPNEIICPDTIDSTFVPTLWNIMAKVRVESFLWGLGTALGELPPYFMARAARLSTFDPDDADDMQAYDELKRLMARGNDLSLIDRLKLYTEKVVDKIGFFGILACASIPNPLFDLAGITCGHFLVPFWKFFGATVIGKALIKMHIQKIFVIIAFNETLVEKAVEFLVVIPIVGAAMQEPFKTLLKGQKSRLHQGHSGGGASGAGHKLKDSAGHPFAYFFEKFVFAMILYFVMSIINSLAQSYHKRIHKNSGKVHRKITKE